MCVVTRGSGGGASGVAVAVGASRHAACPDPSSTEKSVPGAPSNAKLGTTMWSLGRFASAIVVDQPPSQRDHATCPAIGSGYRAATGEEAKRSVCTTTFLLLACKFARNRSRDQVADF